MVNFPKYESYKDSGVEWLGEIPSHWNLQKSKYLWREVEERSISGDKQLLSVSQYSGVIPRNEDSRSESLLDYKQCKPNDLVINIMLAWIGGLDVSQHNGIVSPAYCVYRLRQVQVSKYLGYLYRTSLYLAEFARHSKGVVPSRWRMYTEDFGQVLTLLPSVEEQNRIVKFLDRKTAEIDQAIAQKQRLIELLQEQKAILINQAVTKGLNPNVAMQDSDIKWLDKIPEHWKIKRLKHFSSVQSGITLGKTYTGKKLINYPYLRVANVQYGYFNLDDIAELSLPEREANRYFIKSGDILVTEGGDIDKLGRGTVWESQVEKCLHQNHVFAIRLNKEVASEYFVALVMACDYARQYFIDTAVKTTNLASTNRTKLGNLPILLPSMNEQLELIEYSKKIDVEYNNVISIISTELDKINEFRQSLISEAVTGKIKV